MVSFLQPLNDVTHFLCESDYPTLNIALPMYISLIKDIISVQSQYDAEQLLAPAKKMVLKLKKYLVLALKKPAPICAMILDPRIKMTYFHKNYQLLNTELNLHLCPDSVLSMFCEEAKKYKKIGLEEPCAPKPAK